MELKKRYERYITRLSRDISMLVSRSMRDYFFSGIIDEETECLLIVKDGSKTERKFPSFYKGKLQGEYQEFYEDKLSCIIFLKNGMKFGEQIEY